MKNICFFLALCVVLVVGGAVQAQNAEIAGTVSKVRGEAFRSDGGGQQPLGAGNTVHVGDMIETADNGRIELLFLDGSTLQLSGNSQITIDEMVYSRVEADQSLVKQSLTMIEGVFLMTSGAIAEAKTPGAFEFSTPVATIGIRGTKFLGGRLTVGMPEGTSHYGFQIMEGAISVDAPGGSVNLDNPGEGTFLPFGREAPPTPVRQWTDEEEQEALDLLAF